MKASIFWHIPPYSPLKVNRRFGGTCRPIFRAMWRHFPQKRQLPLNGLHGVISQKMEPYITTAVRTSNPTLCSMFPKSRPKLNINTAR
jgi:hypothetical protein